MPRDVKAGDELFACTINTDDPLVARVLRPVKESSLQKILDLVTSAREQREPVQRTIDKFSEPYALAVMGVETSPSSWCGGWPSKRGTGTSARCTPPSRS